MRGRLLGFRIRNGRIRQMAGVVAAQLGVYILRAEAHCGLCLRHIHSLLVRGRLHHIPAHARRRGKFSQKLRVFAQRAHANVVPRSIQAAHKAACEPALIAVSEERCCPLAGRAGVAAGHGLRSHGLLVCGLLLCERAQARQHGARGRIPVKVRLQMGARNLAARLRCGRVGMHRAHSCNQVIQVRLGPVVPLVYFRVAVVAPGRLGDGRQLVVQQIAVLRRHELSVSAPARGNRGHAQRHAFHVWQAPAFAARGQHKRIRSAVQALHLHRRKFLADYDDGRRTFRGAPKCAQVFVHLLPNGNLFTPAVRLDDEAHIITGAERLYVAGKQHIPAFAQGPLKHREKHEALAPINLQRLHFERVVLLHVQPHRHHGQLVGFNATSCKRIAVEVRGHPNFIHGLAGAHPAGRYAVRLQHGCAHVGQMAGMLQALRGKHILLIGG